MREPRGRVAVLQAIVEIGRQLAFGFPERGGVPLRAIRIVNRNERRLAAHGQAHIEPRQLAIDQVPQAFDTGPLLRRIGFSDTRCLPNPLHLHGVLELNLAVLDEPGDGRRRGRVGRACQRDMTFSGKQSRSRIESDPTRAGQIHLAPGMQVGEVAFRPRRTLERLHIGCELDEITGYEARREAQMAQQLYEQPTRVAA